MKKQFGTAAVILAVFFAVSIVLSLTFITLEADHDCIGEDCPVCAVIAACENTIRTAGSALMATAVILIFRIILMYSLPAVTHAVKATPFSLKVRLLN